MYLNDNFVSDCKTAVATTWHSETKTKYLTKQRLRYFNGKRRNMHRRNFTSAFNLTGLTVFTVVPCFYRREEHTTYRAQAQHHPRWQREATAPVNRGPRQTTSSTNHEGARGARWKHNICKGKTTTIRSKVRTNETEQFRTFTIAQHIMQR